MVRRQEIETEKVREKLFYAEAENARLRKELDELQSPKPRGHAFPFDGGVTEQRLWSLLRKSETELAEARAAPDSQQRALDTLALYAKEVARLNAESARLVQELADRSIVDKRVDDRLRELAVKTVVEQYMRPPGGEDLERWIEKFQGHMLESFSDLARPYLDRATAAEAALAQAKAAQAAAVAAEREAQDRIAVLEVALQPFAKIAEFDVGESETDTDLYRPLHHNTVPRITIGHLRRARAALSSAGAGEAGDEANS